MSILHAFNPSGRSARKPPARPPGSQPSPEERIAAGFAEAIRAHVFDAAREQGVRLGQVDAWVELRSEDGSTPRLSVTVVAAAAGNAGNALSSWLSGTVRQTPVLRVIDASSLAVRVELHQAVAALRARSSKRARRWRPKNV